MEKFCKIQTIFKRDMSKKGALVLGQYSQLEFEYLKDNEWIFTEKVDGTNVRIEWIKDVGIKIGGRTDNAQMPIFLIDRLNELFLPANEVFKNIDKADCLTLYGEGYGAGIQKGGGNYKSDGVDFILFDVLVDSWWLRRKDVEDVAEKLGIDVVPIIGFGNLAHAIDMAQSGFVSRWGDFQAEGIVLRPSCELKTRAGHRIITKIKHKDFK